MITSVALISLFSTAQGTTQTATTPPPTAWAMQTTYAPSSMAAYNLLAEVRIRTQEKEANLRWSFDRDTGRGFAYQAESLSYWPTAAARVKDGLLVAGKRVATGKTLIQAWSFDLGQLPGAGDLSYAPQISKQNLYDADIAGRKIVRLMHEHHGSQSPLGAALVLFGDSNDLYSFDVSTQTLGLVLPASVCPDLALQNWRFVWSGEHANQGYIYVFSDDPNAKLDDGPSLVLIDNNKNMTIDHASRMAKATWDSLLGSPTTWTRVFE